MQYEINYLVLQSKTGQLDEIRQEVKKMIETHGGVISGEKNYLKRKLAYEIKHEQYGFYTVLRFEIEDTEKFSVLKKELNLFADITRYIVVKADSLPALEQTPVQEETTETLTAEAASVADKAPTHQEVLDELISQPKETPAPKVEEKKAEPEVEAPKAPETKEPEAKDKEKKAEDKPVANEKDDKASLDELDKKLDEILNI